MIFLCRFPGIITLFAKSEVATQKWRELSVRIVFFSQAVQLKYWFNLNTDGVPPLIPYSAPFFLPHSSLKSRLVRLLVDARPLDLVDKAWLPSWQHAPLRTGTRQLLGQSA